MTDRIKVLPNQPTAVGMAHPVDGPLKEEGSFWLDDLFTARRLTDGSIVRAPNAAPKVAASDEAGSKTPDAALSEQRAEHPTAVVKRPANEPKPV